MKDSSSDIRLKKRPKQSRSGQTISDILEAGFQIMAEEGPASFTTVRVAERAGVSIGSLYQYFPNKAAILFQMQTGAWARRGRRLEALLADPEVSLLDRLPMMVRTLLRDEHEARNIRAALTDVAPAYRRIPESSEVGVYAMRTVQAYLRGVLPGMDGRDCGVAAELICTTLAAFRKRICAADYDLSQIEVRAESISTMLVAYLTTLRQSDGVDFSAPI